MGKKVRPKKSLLENWKGFNSWFVLPIRLAFFESHLFENCIFLEVLPRKSHYCSFVSLILFQNLDLLSILQYGFEMIRLALQLLSSIDLSYVPQDTQYIRIHYCWTVGVCVYIHFIVASGKLSHRIYSLHHMKGNTSYSMNSSSGCTSYTGGVPAADASCCVKGVKVRHGCVYV